MKSQFEKVAKECEKMKKENEKLKTELKGLDFVSILYTCTVVDTPPPNPSSVFDHKLTIVNRYIRPRIIN